MKRGKLRESLKISFTEGVFASMMLGFTENFWVACGEALQVTALMAGLVSTLPQLVASFLQIIAGILTEKLGGRLKTIRKVVSLQWCALLPLISLPLIPEQFRYPLLLACAIFFAIGGTLPGPAWLSLMSDHLPPQSKGKYFGWRNRILGSVALLCGLAAGQILQQFKNNVVAGFSVLFALACLARWVSWSLLSRMADIPLRRPELPNGNGNPQETGSFTQFIHMNSENNFAKFSIFVFFFMFSVNVVAPYLPIYMIRDLRYSYATFSYVTFSATVASLFGMKIWGELADKFGNLKVIRATTIFIAIIPLLWFVSGDPVWLVCVQIAAGFVWAGFQLNVMTFAFSEVTSISRTRVIGYLSALNGMGIFLGSCLGGGLLKILPTLGRSHFLGLFLVSALFRALTVSFFLKNLTEKRSVQPASTLSLYADALGLYPLLTSSKEILEIVLRRKRE
ncbi:MAG: MFS transporter [Elusimicrobia bacterium]|nr:MFS transporter [Elusimicrobiota bacterium]